MSLAPPVAKDGFFYNGDLYVDVGNFNRHKRASIPEITALLRPDLKKATNVQAPKDQVGHWYEAQLIHYGLPPSKDKARAKMRLLEALNGSKLVVPKEISKLEADMKKEYAAADRKARAEYKKQMGATEMKTTAAGKKRKQSDTDTTNNFNVNINFGSQGEVTVSGFTPEKQPPAKRPKTAAPKAATPKASSKKDQDETRGDQDDWPKPKAPRSRGGSSIQTARRSTGSFPVGQRSTAAAPSSSPERPRPKQTARRSAGFVPMGQRSNPAFKAEPAVKKETKVKTETSTEDLPKLGLLNGHYDIECPTIEGEWPDWAADGLSLVLTLDTPGMWGAYDFGMFSGIIHFPNRPMVSSYEPIPCQWRGRENSEGQMSFGDQCTGAITFLGGGMIQGWLSLYGRCEFVGSRRAGPGNAPRTAVSMREEWNEYNQGEYDAASRSRWGGSGGW